MQHYVSHLQHFFFPCIVSLMQQSRMTSIGSKTEWRARLSRREQRSTFQQGRPDHQTVPAMMGPVESGDLINTKGEKK
jgi:hypothetical protein